jgi:hypothetical protein
VMQVNVRSMAEVPIARRAASSTGETGAIGVLGSRRGGGLTSRFSHAA